MSIVHVLPLRDVVEHLVPGGLDGHEGAPGQWLMLETDPKALEIECVCGPATELVSGPHRDGWLVTHHSLDGREARE